jgi:PAS domain S-box-containing protein
MTMRVLVVDDDESGRYLIATLMRGHGYDVIEAVDGEDALHQARSISVDVVVTDILMPKMDGYQLCREWKSDPELSQAPLIFYSATYTDPADMRFADGIGADAFFVKPLEPDVLVSRIEAVLREHADKHTQSREPSMTEETEVLSEYNERLVSKLEQKIVELDRANRDLTQTLKVLSDEVAVKETLVEQLNLDVRLREKAQEDLSVTTELLRTIISSAPLAIVAVDLDWNVRLCNPGATRLLGWDEDEMLGKPFPPAVGHEDEFERLYGPLRSGAQQVLQAETVRPRKDGSTIDLRAYTAALHGPDGAVNGLISLFTDVTEQRHIEMVKSAFLSVVSHELRTPLTAIIGYADVLEQVEPENDPARVHQIVGKIRAQGSRMRALVENLLEVSQIQSEPLRLTLAEVDIVALLRGVTGRAELGPAHTVVFDADADIPLLRADAPRLETVFSQMIGNAVKYSPAGGEIRIEARREGGGVCVSVSDRGIGIDSSDLEYIFGSFTQADMSDRRSFGGIGVGLFVARQIVEAHRGRMEVASKPGEGSAFSVLLPVT